MTTNLQELSVSELARSLKRTVEDAYSLVRVRGEVSGFKRAASGHLYLALKDSDAVLDAVCWRGSASRLMVRPEDGMEVIATGRLTTYPGRSKYQIVIEQMELAGEGALLKLLEERRRRLAEEGLFDEDRKRALPFLPNIIGVVTSPTGAVIRDILHRLSDRFPRQVVLWPVLVQGDTAAAQIAAAIDGFNALPADGTVPRPDLLIVARGGGSLEDLWAFNEEVVVRAAAASSIPLISAVGHETDTTLIDFASDRRAPTPTAAAEIAVPVRAELMADLSGFAQRMIHGANRGLDHRRRYLEGLVRGLPRPDRLIDGGRQRLDDVSERLLLAPKQRLSTLTDRLAVRVARLISPQDALLRHERTLDGLADRLQAAGTSLIRRNMQRYADLNSGERMAGAQARAMRQRSQALGRFGDALEALGYRGTLKRGYAVVRDEDGRLVSAGSGLATGQGIEIEFTDRRIDAVVRAKPSAKKEKAKPADSGQQEELF